MTIKRLHMVVFTNDDGDSITVAAAAPALTDVYNVAVGGNWHAQVRATREHGIQVLAGTLTTHQTNDVGLAMLPVIPNHRKHGDRDRG